MSDNMQSKLFELSELLRWFMEEGYSLQDMGTGHGLQVVPHDFFLEEPDTFHVYPHGVFQSLTNYTRKEND